MSAEETPVTPASTANGGQPRFAVDGRTRLPAAGADDPPTDQARDPVRDLAQSALADAQGMSRQAGRRRARRARQLGRSPGGYTGPGSDERDPQLLAGLLPGYLDELGWQRPLAEARVFAEWPSLVGPDVAAHCAPSALRDGELKITAESTAWATQLRLLAGTMLARIVGELGPQVVTKLVISGPVGPNWKHGGWSVRGSRGPRDTYG